MAAVHSAGIETIATKQSEMMALGERLSRALCDIREHNDRSGDMLNRFCNEPLPAPGPGSPVVQSAEPAPGTLGSLTMLAERLVQEANRYENISAKLRSLL